MLTFAEPAGYKPGTTLTVKPRLPPIAEYKHIFEEKFPTVSQVSKKPTSFLSVH